MGKALIHRWQHSKVESYVTNVFYNDPYTTCYLANKYIQPQLLSSHVNLGSGDNTCQNSISFHLENNGTLVNKAYWVSCCKFSFFLYIQRELFFHPLSGKFQNLCPTFIEKIQFGSKARQGWKNPGFFQKPTHLGFSGFFL